MPARAIMIQGTASSAGKSIIATALCRMLHEDGFRVAPFKAQNMALNSFVSADGGEIGRSQAAQAEAAGVEATVRMNPILLKPESGARCQVVVLGRPYATIAAGNYFDYKGQLWPVVVESYRQLAEQYDVIVIEGAGSPAEVNLRDSDIVNMRVAKLAQAPVMLVADIDRGGAFASLVGTLELLEPDERELVKALALNKFRGDVSLLRPGLEIVERRTGVPVVGVIPYISDLRVAQEDSVVLEGRPWADKSDARLDIAIIHLPHISNFDDFDPLEAEPAVRLRLVQSASELGRPDLIVLPGTKSTLHDLAYLEVTGLAKRIVECVAEGTPVIGICGGFQMLGTALHDPEHVESATTHANGLGLLPIETTFEPAKATHRVRGQVRAARGLLARAEGQMVEGYEIHMGRTTGVAEAALRVTERAGQTVDDGDGALSADGLVFGTYVHGLFDAAGFRRAVLTWMAERKGVTLDLRDSLSRDQEYSRLAEVVRRNMDVEMVYRLVGV